MFTERGVYRTGETVHVTALLRDAESIAVTGVPLTLVVTAPTASSIGEMLCRIRALLERSLDVPILGADRDLASPPSPIRSGLPSAEATFLVEDYVADRLEIRSLHRGDQHLAGGAGKIKVDGRFLYGAPASGLTLDGEINIAEVTGTGLRRPCIRPRRR